MLLTVDVVSQLISQGKVLHIAGAAALLKKLPRGNWIGGSTEYFMAEGGGRTSDELLHVDALSYREFVISTYDADTIADVTVDACESGFSIVIIPSDSATRKAYAEKAAGFDGMFIKNIVGWISGGNSENDEGSAIVVDGSTGEVYKDKAVVLHLSVPEGKTVNIGIINIFEPDENSPVIEFDEEGFTVEKCRVNGEEAVLADYIAGSGIDTRLPLVGNYSGAGINSAFRSLEGGRVRFYAPVFAGIQYRIAKPLAMDYASEFACRLSQMKDADVVFSCSCVLNYIYGELEGKDTRAFSGPITFGEIAYQLVSQTLVYVVMV